MRFHRASTDLVLPRRRPFPQVKRAELKIAALGREVEAAQAEAAEAVAQVRSAPLRCPPDCLLSAG